MGAPLLEGLRAFAEAQTLRMHMPGHKGSLPFLPELDGAARLDFTELAPTGNLYSGGGLIGRAEARFARAFSMENAQLLTGGATQGIFTALFYAARRGKKLLMCRGSHFSAYNACGLLGLEPSYLQQESILPFGCAAALTPEAVEKALEGENFSALLLTSPSYYGVLTPLAEIAEICRKRGTLLIVDGAHGAHLPFMEGFEQVFAGADIVISSAHKTLPALGQTALLLSGPGVDAGELRRASALFGTSSPSYALMASLDGAGAYMEGEGRGEYARAAESVREIRADINKNSTFSALDVEFSDPLRLVVNTARAGLSGHEAGEKLEEMGVYVEMADGQSVLCIVTGQDRDGDLARLHRALRALEEQAPGAPLPLPAPAPEAKRALSPAEGLWKGRESLPLSACAGRVAGAPVVIYPPGVPLIAAGEIIEEKHLAYLRGMRYNMNGSIEVLIIE